MGRKKDIVIYDHEGRNEEFDPCKLYNWRLDWLEKQITKHRQSGRDISETQYQRWYDDEERTFQNNTKDLESARKFKASIGIIVPSHYYHVKWLGACLRSLKQTGLHVLLAYDNPFFADNLRHETRLPTPVTMMLADSFVMKHKTWGSGVGIPHAWNMWYGLKMLKAMGFDYVFNLNGDCILEKPENFPKLVEMLGTADIISCEFIPKKKYLGTMAWLAKLDVALEVWEQYIKTLYHFNIGNAEARMGRHLIDRKYQIIPVRNPYEAHFKPFPHETETDSATFRTLLGLRHLHAEHKVRRDQKMEPVPGEYCEYGPSMQFMNGFEQRTIVKYWETGERQYLEAWWNGK